MSEEYREQVLERAFQATSDGASHGPDCPTVERLMDALEGRLDGEATGAVVDHLAGCGACAEDWRTAHAFQKEAAAVDAHTQGVAEVVPFPLIKWMRLPALAAAVLLAFLFLRPREAVTEPPTTFRASEEHTQITSLIGTEPLPREQCLLRWQLTPEVTGATFKVQVTTTDIFQVVLLAEQLEEDQLQIPADKLKELPPDSRLLWWVEVTLPEGSTVRSATFSQELAE